ncbi:MAG: ATP-binding cassette domain-containing protein [Paramuribaculum sp.]|nr:ATP-binding cassette domain-containing protein [Paramuribaculum sp.]
MIVDYRNVELSRKELVVLKNVDFKVDRNEFVYIIGKVGSGKSTLLKSLYAESPVSGGDAHVLDYDMSQLRRRDIPMLRRRLGIVFQDFQLLPDRDVNDNLMFVLKATGWSKKAEIDYRIHEVLSKVGMVNKSYKFPHELSGGEQQRIAIARALLNNPELIIADEPTGNLDSETANEVVGGLYEIACGGTPVIMATHNPTFMERYPGRVCRCENKQFICD